MPRFKGNEHQHLMVPVDLDQQLLPGTLEHAINYLIDREVDLAGFTVHYHNDESGRPAYDPKALLKVTLFAYSKGILSSRRIEEACKTNIVFMALCGDVHPDHATIARFLSSRSSAIRDVFRDVLVLAAQNDLIGAEAFALDGCKIPSNAAKEHSGTFAEIRRKVQKLEARLGSMIKEHHQTDRSEKTKDDERSPRPPEAGGTAGNEEKYRRSIERAKEFLACHEPKIGALGKEVKSNITDNDSAKLKSGSGYIQGYNALALVDAKRQFIVHAEPVGQIHEAPFLPRMIRRGAHALRKAGVSAGRLSAAAFIADTNYFSESNARFLFSNSLDGYVPDHHFRSRDPRFPERNQARRRGHKKFTIQDFIYDRATDTYRCPADKPLQFYTHARAKGLPGARYRAEQAHCSSCALTAQCLKKGATRRSLFIADSPRQSYAQGMMKKIDSPSARSVYARRMGIIEPVFANITATKGMRRFTFRGRAKVRIQWLYFCLVHNIEKLANAGALTLAPTS
jgi:transposase